jgi:hypothetical protein
MQNWSLPEVLISKPKRSCSSTQWLQIGRGQPVQCPCVAGFRVSLKNSQIEYNREWSLQVHGRTCNNQYSRYYKRGDTRTWVPSKKQHVEGRLFGPYLEQFVAKLQGIVAGSQIGRGWVGDETLDIGEGQIRRAVGSGWPAACTELGVRRHKGCISDQLVHRGMHGGCSTGNGARGWQGSAAVPGTASAGSAVVSRNGARDGLCGDGRGFPSRSWSGSGMEMARPWGRGAADFWARPRGRRSGRAHRRSRTGLLRCLGTGMAAAGSAGMAGKASAGSTDGFCRVSGCGDGGCGNGAWVCGDGGVFL